MRGLTLYLLLSLPALCSTQGGRLDTRVEHNIDFWSTNTLTSHLSTPISLGYDALIFLYLPYDQKTDDIGGMVVRVGEILNFGFQLPNNSANSNNLGGELGTVNVFFDCAQDQQAKELCKKVTGASVTDEAEWLQGKSADKSYSYPKLFYLKDNAARKNNSRKGKEILKSGLKRLIEFKGDVHRGEEIRDFCIGIRKLRSMEGLGGRIRRFLTFWRRGVGGEDGGGGGGGGTPNGWSTGREIGLKRDWPQFRNSNSNNNGNGNGNNEALLLDDISTLEANQEQLLESIAINSIITEGFLLQFDNDLDVFSKLDPKDEIVTSCVMDLTIDYCSRLINAVDFKSQGGEELDEEAVYAEVQRIDPYCLPTNLNECADEFRGTKNGKISDKCGGEGLCPLASRGACLYVNVSERSEPTHTSTTKLTHSTILTQACLNEEVQAEFMRAQMEAQDNKVE